MTELRDRIAAVLGTAEVVLDGWDYLNDTSRFLLADVLIRELGLHREEGITSPLKTAVWPAGSVPNCPSNTHRYVTEWEPTP